MKAIRQKCIECCAGSANEVKLCDIEDCALHPFRLGKNPNIKRTMSEEQKEASKIRLMQYRENKKNGDM